MSVALALLGAASHWQQRILPHKAQETAVPTPASALRHRRPAAPIPSLSRRSADTAEAGQTECRRRVRLAGERFAGTGRHRYLDKLSFAGIKARGVHVHLPADYARQSQRHYPVLYVHDGQYVHDGELAVDVAVDALVARGLIEPHIIVGIERSAERSRELKPAFARRPGPHLQAYAHFLVDEVMPRIDGHFRTRCGRLDRSLVGYSLGGLANLYLMLWYPERFGRIAAMSPSLWWSDRQVLRDIAQHTGPWPARLWLDAGTREGRAHDIVPYFIADIRRARDLLRARGLELGTQLGYLEDVGAIHAGWAGGRRMPAALAFLLSHRLPQWRKPHHVALRLFKNKVPRKGRTNLSVSAYYHPPFTLTWPNETLQLQSDPLTPLRLSIRGDVQPSATGHFTVRAQLFGQSAEDTLWVTP